ncbi:hypothetical protein ACROYT_G037809 [Oculina patagonica]
MELLRSYLSSRFQRVKLSGTYSAWKEVSRGVPQGSILGPLLFNIFMNDMIYAIRECKLLSYADDTKIYHSHASPGAVELAVNQDLENAATWFKENGMKANPDKYQAIVLGKNSQEISLKSGDINIPIKDQISLLGVTLDSKLKFDAHVAIGANKVVVVVVVVVVVEWRPVNAQCFTEEQKGNHKTCQQLRSISLGTMGLGHLSCLKAFTERGLLFLMMSSTSGEGTDCGEDSNTDACLLFALNPKNSKMICLECFYLEKRLNTVGTNGQYIAAGQQATGKVNIWNITNSQSHATLQVFQDEVNSIGFHQDRPVIAFGSTSGCVHLFSMC